MMQARDTFLALFLLCFAPALFAAELGAHSIQIVNHFDARFNVATNEEAVLTDFAYALEENQTLTFGLTPGYTAYIGFYIDPNHTKYQDYEAGAFMGFESALFNDNTYSVEVHGYTVGQKMAYSWSSTPEKTTVTFCSSAAYVAHHYSCP
jgi:hypothetical protein